MRYFKANEEIRAIDESQEFLINDEWLEISHNEMIEILNPQKTETEILNQQINEYKVYLDKTEHKFNGDYEPKEDEDLETIKAKRREARKFIRDNK